MAYYGYVVEVKELRKHNNADRLQVVTFFGSNDTIVSLDTKVGDIGVYFPVDGQLSKEFCEHNDLVRRKDENGNNVGGYLDPEKRNIKALRLRGEKSDGLFLPLDCLDYCYDNGSASEYLKIGDKIDVVNGQDICCKYVPRTNHRAMGGRVSKERKHKDPISPLFKEHIDTEQLAYNLDIFKPGDEIEITLKMHGTSQRTGYLPVLKGHKKSLLDRILRKEGKPIYDWGYVTGTRRVVLDDFEGGFYGGNEFREEHSKFFEGKLWKGETVYYEVVGYTDQGVPIMPQGDNRKLNDKDIIKQYGETTTFNYGCEVGQSKAYVYRMTMTNEDGDVVEYTPDFMRYRCEQMGANTVMVFDKFIIPDVTKASSTFGETFFGGATTAGEYVKWKAEQYFDGPCPIGKTHVREGVVVRIINRPSFTAVKHKNFTFKCLTGIITENLKDTNMSEDMLSEV